MTKDELLKQRMLQVRRSDAYMYCWMVLSSLVVLLVALNMASRFFFIPTQEDMLENQLKLIETDRFLGRSTLEGEAELLRQERLMRWLRLMAWQRNIETNDQ